MSFIAAALLIATTVMLVRRPTRRRGLRVAAVLALTGMALLALDHALSYWTADAGVQATPGLLGLGGGLLLMTSFVVATVAVAVAVARRLLIWITRRAER